MEAGVELHRVAFLLDCVLNITRHAVYYRLPSVRPSFYPSVLPSIRLAFRQLSVHLPCSPSVYLLAQLFVRPSICPVVRPSIC